MIYQSRAEISVCQLCSQPIELLTGPDGRYWWYSQSSPGRPGTPWCPVTPGGGQRAPLTHLAVPPTFEEFREFMFRDFMAGAPRLEMRQVGHQLFSRVLLMNRACARRLLGTEADPFFINTRISAAWRAIEARWVA